MGKTPEDYDIATDATPQDIMRLFPRTIPVGVQFGIVIVLLKGIQYEVAQFRVAPGTAEPLREDALHRDFTINGMFYDPFADQVFDYVGGRHDIQQKMLRCIATPEDRFEEDRLRMLRAIRFACAFGYEIDSATFAAMRRFAPRIIEVSAERIREEVLKILTGSDPARGLRLLDETGLLERILPEVAALQGVPQPAEFHPEGDVWRHTLLMLQAMATSSPNISPELAMAVLLHDIGKPATFSATNRIHFYKHACVGGKIAEQICGRLKFSTNATEKIITLVQEHMQFFDVAQMKKSTLKRFLRQEHIVDLLELHRLDCLSSDGDLRTYEFCQAKRAEFRAEAMRPPKLISGDDLIQAGFAPGPVFKQVLEYIEDAQLEGIISTKSQALALVTDIWDTLQKTHA